MKYMNIYVFKGKGQNEGVTSFYYFNNIYEQNKNKTSSNVFMNRGTIASVNKDPLTQQTQAVPTSIARHICVCVTFMLGGAVRGGEGGQSPTATLEMVSSSCFLKMKNNNNTGILYCSYKKTHTHTRCGPREAHKTRTA